jgi:hypothetical protein
MTWLEFKILVVDKKLLMQYTATPLMYSLTALDGGFTYETEVCRDMENLPSGKYVDVESVALEDFETNFKDGANKSMDPRSQEGIPYQTPTASTGDKRVTMYSHPLVDAQGNKPPANTISTYDKQVIEELEFTGAMLRSDGGNFGDTLRLMVYDVDSIIPEFMRPAFPTWPLIGEYTEPETGIYMMPACRIDVMTSDKAVLPAGLYFRAIYNNTGTNLPEVIVYYIVKR